MLEDLLHIKELLKWPDDVQRYVVESFVFCRANKELFDELKDLEEIVKKNQFELLEQWYNRDLSSVLKFHQFHICAVVTIIPVFFNEYERLEIPKSMAISILSDIERWMRDYERKNGSLGFLKFWWLSKHLRLKTFQLGDLQYELSDFSYPFIGLRNIINGELIFILQANTYFSENGQFLYKNQSASNSLLFSAFKESSEFFKGNLVRSNGYIDLIPSSLLKSEWQIILQFGDPFLIVHFPEACSLELKNLSSSFALAKEFFSHYFSSEKVHFFGTKTWFMDDQIQFYLPESRIAQFQRSLYLLPIEDGNEKQTYERVFGDSEIDIAEMKPLTSLQKHVKAHVDNSGRWVQKSFVLYFEDIPLQIDRYKNFTKEIG